MEDSIIAMVLLNSEKYKIDRGSKYHGDMVIFVFEGIVQGPSKAGIDIILNRVNILCS